MSINYPNGSPNRDPHGFDIGDEFRTSRLDPKEVEKMLRRMEASKAEKAEKADRFNKGKLQWRHVNWKYLEPMVKGLEYGAGKYGMKNYMKGLDKTEVLESLLRHSFALLDGEEIDEESGLPHECLIQSNALFLGEFYNPKG